MTYDPRYLEGIEAFNRGDYYDAHEVWEGLWQDCHEFDRAFYQSLIQAAVAIYHKNRNNLVGARRVFAKGQAKIIAYRPHHLGLDIDAFWRDVEATIQTTSFVPTIILNIRGSHRE